MKSCCRGTRKRALRKRTRSPEYASGALEENIGIPIHESIHFIFVEMRPRPQSGYSVENCSNICNGFLLKDSWTGNVIKYTNFGVITWSFEQRDSRASTRYEWLRKGWMILDSEVLTTLWTTTLLWESGTLETVLSPSPAHQGRSEAQTLRRILFRTDFLCGTKCTCGIIDRFLVRCERILWFSS